MANIYRDKRNGKVNYRLQFCDLHEKRRSIRLGVSNKRAAEAIRVRVEELISAEISGSSPGNETCRWLATIGDDLASKLTNAGLGKFIPRRESSTLGAFLPDYIDGRKVELAKNTLLNFQQTQSQLEKFFGADRDLRAITPGSGDEWRESLVKNGLAEATINRHVKRARQFFKSAMRKGLVESNPFAEVRSGSEVNKTRQFFVDDAMMKKVLACCPDAEWRVIISLARYGGLRCPSEVLELRWSDIDWYKKKINVSAPKTANQGKPFRLIPLFPELEVTLRELREQAAEGAEFVITSYQSEKVNLRTHLHRIIKKSGIKPWAKTFVNLRSSRETELADQVPLHVACEWIGNSEIIALNHCLQVTEDHFDAALQSDTHKGGATVGAVNGEKGMSAGDHYTTQTSKNPVQHGIAGVFDALQVPPRGVEQQAVFR